MRRRAHLWFVLVNLLLPSSFGWAAVVPRVGGQTQADAQAALAAANLTVGTISGKILAFIPAGIVVGQEPPSGTALPDGSAVDLLVSLPAPAEGQLMPDGWAGEWQLTTALRNLSTDTLGDEEIVTDTICPGDPLGLEPLGSLANCSGVVTEEMLDVLCTAQVIVGACTLDGSVQFTGERTGDSLSGEGQWSTLGSGDCSGLPANLPANQGESITVVGTRLSTDLSACGTVTSSFLQKFVGGAHPSLVSLEQLAGEDDDGDDDGVVDAEDSCPSTAPGEVVDPAGCSIADLCPCGNEWRNHGAYVSCVAHATEDFVVNGLITEEQKDAIVSAAGHSRCGKQDKERHHHKENEDRHHHKENKERHHHKEGRRKLSL